MYRIASSGLLFVVFTAFVGTADGATLAYNGFEGDPGELPYVTSVSDNAQGQIIVQSNPPVFAGTQSLMFDKQTDQPQIDFSAVFDQVDISQFINVALNIQWHPNINDNNYEPQDSLTFTINHDGTGGPIVLNFDSTDLNTARDGTSTDEWQDLLVNVPDDATMLDFTIAANFNAENEDMFFDQLVITGTAVPEPASIVLWSLLGVIGLGYSLRRWYR